ncbi:Gfo/Idh/MocA family oxidoreductase [Deinococcus metallilatus]|uniref:Dehydrogenase n=1 Tax=Deinococcus metallilatus TaxID=1211322 RepID=A0AAJ5F3F2_9DEIO|nr:Gfo/Idh/MocA family oxidoreductase [Deinococcus metallilatus]MBB5294103.1 putative dehydrogenase [Deinococcus metallilatus]QBY08888.1 Gfo/Idh/MocA family oxidoreductase [Deinococcus metallilatus]RXJ10032.1 Gfo/Idh/MocA family oxidoreductase [Deinococcus metallilatus]TLK28031.1 Gfo/Idh/MocA family oxidoreductase [Deinococcus metallilatus]GMA16561.1 streptomycin biosynthesis protein StrI [Deinococcus metallilatus]
MTPTVAILGCGNRGADVYARHLSAQGARVTHLVDPRPARLAEVAARHGLPPEACFLDWKAFFALGRVADAVVIATPDDAHVGPCLRALELGYDVLLEKPVCLSEPELDRLLAAEAASTGRVTVCHVLRATAFFRAVRGVLDSGRLGKLIGIQHAENVAFWHYAHSYVRGNWAQSPPAAPFVLAKSGHDLDLLRWFADAPPVRVSSEGCLNHFRPEEAPPGASDRCVTCPVVGCPYDARRIYGTRDPDRWPVTVLTAGGVSLAEALARGPYGRCVYGAGNDVVDHQAVTVTFASGVTAQLTVSAFTHNNTRTLKLLGTHGELRGQMERGEIELHDFRTGGAERLCVDTSGNHGGGDEALVAAWLAFLRGEADVPTPLAESFDSHRLAFAAERARLRGTVEQV